MATGMGGKNPNKKNSTSFSKVHQPANNDVSPGCKGKDELRPAPCKAGPGRPKGRRNKRTEAQFAFEQMGYNPAEVQVALALRLQEIIAKGMDEDTTDHLGNIVPGKVFTILQRCKLLEQLSRMNDVLMQYQAPKATPEMEEYNIPASQEEQEEEQEVRILAPLTPKELMESKKKMLEDKIALKNRLG